VNVTRTRIIARGLAGHCPNCGGPTLFKPGALFSVNEQCARCGLKFDRGEGFFLGPWIFNYTATVVLFIVPVVLLCVHGMIGTRTALAAAGAAAILVPMALYRLSWSWWLMTYFYFLPQKLPQNQDALHEDEEE
jgi:uncharacterized protein (DUF983 family)